MGWRILKAGEIVHVKADGREGVLVRKQHGGPDGTWVVLIDGREEYYAPWQLE